MAQATRQRRIEASPDAVWEALADFGGLAVWAPNVAHSALTTVTRNGIGTARRVQSGRTALLETVVDWEPPATVAYRIDGLPKVVRHAENRWRLDGVGAATDVTLTSTVDTGNRPPQLLVARIVARVMARVSDQLLAGLAAHLEGTARV